MNIWDDTTSEYELFEEQFDMEDVEELDVDSVQEPEIVEASEEEIEAINNASSFTLSEQESNTIYNARLRLEQARLYEMLINHNIFEGVQADERAVQVVQNELKLYIVKRLEVLMGLRKPKAKVVAAPVAQSESFNEVEVDFLKQLAYKGTNGASVTASKATPKPNPIVKSEPAKLKTLTPQAPAKPKPVVTQTPAPQVKSNTTPQAAQPPKRGRPPKADKPVSKAQDLAKKVIKNLGEKPRNLTQAEIEYLAKQDLKETAKKKPFHEMTPAEKEKEMQRVNEKYKKPKPQNAVPIPSFEQQVMLYQTQQVSKTQDPRLELGKAIAGRLVQQHIQVDSDDTGDDFNY